MKKSLVFSVLVAVIVGFGFASCGNKKEKSDEKDIIKFSVNGVAYNKSGSSFTYTYPKTGAGAWTPPIPNWPVAPTIEISKDATISPSAETKQNFEAAAVTYTVTAQDGSTATFTVKADRSTEIGK